MINGVEVREFVVIAPILVGEKLPPGMPTTIRYEIRPNRFIPVSEDADGIYYQGDGAFQNTVSHATLGGLYVTKKPPVRIHPYTGDASYPRMRLSHGFSLDAADLRKVKARSGRTTKKK